MLGTDDLPDIGKREMQIRAKNIYSNMSNYKLNLSSNIIDDFETEKKM